MNSKGASRFVSDAGTEVSVRTSRNVKTDALMIEPMYATDIEILEGATGALHADGDALRGTLRRNGGAFVLTSDLPRPRRVTRKKTETAPPAAPVGRRVAATSAPRVAEARNSAPPADEALEAVDTLLRFARGESGIALTLARRAHFVIGRFLADRERQERAPD